MGMVPPDLRHEYQEGAELRVARVVGGALTQVGQAPQSSDGEGKRRTDKPRAGDAWRRRMSRSSHAWVLMGLCFFLPRICCGQQNLLEGDSSFETGYGVWKESGAIDQV